MNKMSLFRCTLETETTEVSPEQACKELISRLESIGIKVRFSDFAKPKEHCWLRDEYGWTLPRATKIIVSPRPSAKQFGLIPIKFNDLYPEKDFNTMQFDEFNKLIHSPECRVLAKEYVKSHYGFNPHNFSITVK